MSTVPRRSNSSAGFTLAEAAVTIAIVSLVILMIVQGLESAKFSAYHTKVRKTAYELAIGLLGEVEAGLFREELDSGMSGSFADKDYPAYEWEIAIGDDVFEESDDDDERPFDNLKARRDWREEQEDENRPFGERESEEDEEAEEPFEKIKVRVIYPVMDEDRPNELVLERWVPWREIYGEPEEEEVVGESGEEGGEAAGAGAAGNGASATGGAAGTIGGGAPKGGGR